MSVPVDGGGAALQLNEDSGFLVFTVSAIVGASYGVGLTVAWILASAPLAVLIAGVSILVLSAAGIVTGLLAMWRG